MRRTKCSGRVTVAYEPSYPLRYKAHWDESLRLSHRRYRIQRILDLAARLVGEN